MRQSGARILRKDELNEACIGKRVGDGTFGNVYLFEGENHVIKVLNDKNDHALDELKALWCVFLSFSHSFLHSFFFFFFFFFIFFYFILFYFFF